VSIGGTSHLENLLLSISTWMSPANIHVATDSVAIDYVVTKAGYTTIRTGPAENGTARIAIAADSLDLHENDWVLNIQGDLISVSPEMGLSLLTTLKDADDVGANWVTFADEKIWEPGEVGSNSGSVWVEVDGSSRGIMFGREVNPRTSATNCKFHSHIGLYAYKPAILRQYIDLEITQNEKDHSLEQFRLLDAGLQPFVGLLSSVPIEINTENDYVQALLKHTEAVE
jgi:3-deoxy-manno-octulosonate cytidylyltransferase (CMP-KDO synthetase)